MLENKILQKLSCDKTRKLQITDEIIKLGLELHNSRKQFTAGKGIVLKSLKDLRQFKSHKNSI